MGERLNSKIKVKKYPIFTEKIDVTLNIFILKYTLNFQIMPFMIQNKTQISSNTHRYKKIVKKILTQRSNHTYKLQKMSHVTFLIKNGVIKKIEYQIHKNSFGELLYHYYTTTVST